MKFKHSGNIGDILFSLPTIYSLAKQHGGEPTLYLHTNVHAQYYRGCQHPSGQYRLTEQGALDLIPLLDSQGIGTWIWNGEQVDVDLDLFRALPGIEHGHLPRHYFHVFDAWWDLSSPWLTVPVVKHGRLVVNRTFRYQNSAVSYNFLAQYKPLFVGLEFEFLELQKQIPNLEYVPCDNLFEVAKVIAGGYFVGNQSGLNSIAESLKVPRCLELCPWARNVSCQGGLTMDALGQGGFEANVKRMVELTSNKC